MEEEQKADKNIFHIVSVSDTSSEQLSLTSQLLKGPLETRPKPQSNVKPMQTSNDNPKVADNASIIHASGHHLSNSLQIATDEQSVLDFPTSSFRPQQISPPTTSSRKPSILSDRSSVSSRKKFTKFHICEMKEVEGSGKVFKFPWLRAASKLPPCLPSSRSSAKDRISCNNPIVVTKVEEPNIQTTIAENQDGVNDNRDLENQPLQKEITNDDYALYEEDILAMPTVSNFLSSFSWPGAQKADSKGRKKAKLGLLIGVYLPTMQHIFGVLMFLRLFWMVGTAGVIQTFFMVFLCCTCTFLTSISMSAIATNGVVESGGAYFMLSRNLGPEFGSAVGILFYLANAFATAMYLVGGVEILLVSKLEESVDRN